MARRRRLEFVGGTFHVYARGNRRSRVFLGEDDYRSFVEDLRYLAREHDVAVIAYSLMPNHYLCAAPHKTCYGERSVMRSGSRKPASETVRDGTGVHIHIHIPGRGSVVTFPWSPPNWFPLAGLEM